MLRPVPLAGLVPRRADSNCWNLFSKFDFFYERRPVAAYTEEARHTSLVGTSLKPVNGMAKKKGGKRGKKPQTHQPNASSRPARPGASHSPCSSPASPPASPAASPPASPAGFPAASRYPWQGAVTRIGKRCEVHTLGLMDKVRLSTVVMQDMSDHFQFLCKVRKELEDAATDNTRKHTILKGLAEVHARRAHSSDVAAVRKVAAWREQLAKAEQVARDLKSDFCRFNIILTEFQSSPTYATLMRIVAERTVTGPSGAVVVVPTAEEKAREDELSFDELLAEMKAERKAEIQAEMKAERTVGAGDGIVRRGEGRGGSRGGEACTDSTSTSARSANHLLHLAASALGEEGTDG